MSEQYTKSESEAYWHGRGRQAQLSEQTIENLRAQLERVRGERDAARNGWAATTDELRRAIAERAAARAAAASWKRSAKMWRFMALDYAAAMTMGHNVEVYLTAKQNLTDDNAWHIERRLDD